MRDAEMTAAPLIGSDHAAALIRSYSPFPDVWDELMTPERAARPHWRPFVAGLDAMAEGDVARRWRKAERMLHENGLTYSAQAGEPGSERPWSLDFVPLLMPAAEWRVLEEGLKQRARLLNTILADLYGPQRLLRDGHIPAALVFANPHFARPCHGIVPRDGVYLHFYAADLGRGPDGRWWVLADRTQAPSGVGYALENRIVLSRVLPELFRETRVHRLARHFLTVHDGLIRRTRRDNPRIVLLTPGPSVDGYFAHAYLARYLGYTLAEGTDLTVRDNAVFLRTVDGLKSIDLIFRGVDSEDCDSLEMRPTSTFGVAGLVQAARSGSVTVANALGSGVVEAKAWMGYLPNLCRVLLGEDLKLPNTATWWCGDEAARSFVLASVDRLTVDLAFERRPLLAVRTGAVAGEDLTPSQRDVLVERITGRGHAYVGQEQVVLSTTPVWADGTLKPRPMSLRVFLAASGEDYDMMPGGLTRAAESADVRAVSLHRGERTKDTWVLSDEPVTTFSLLRSPSLAASPRRTGKDLPSHAADNLFWLGRYAERAEGTMRVLRSVMRRLTEDAGPGDDRTAMERVLKVLTAKTGIGTAESGVDATAALDRQLRAMMFQSDRAYTLGDTLGHLHRTASLVRDRLSLDAWQILNRFRLEAARGMAQAGAAAADLDDGEILEVLDGGLRTMAAFSGMEMENMTRNHGWRFLDAGRRMERATHMAELLREVLVQGDPEEDGSLILLLELADSFMTYRSRYLTTPAVAPVIDLLLLDDSNPRSVAFQVVALADHVDRLPRGDEAPTVSDEQRVVIALRTDLQLAQAAALAAADETGARSQLDALLKRVIQGMPRLSELVTATHFSHAEAQRAAEILPRTAQP